MKRPLLKSAVLVLLFLISAFLRPVMALELGREHHLQKLGLATPELVNDLTAGSWFTRTEAAATLATSDITPVISDLRQLSGEEYQGFGYPDGQVRQTATELLAHLSPQPYIETLANARASLEERINAANLLGYIRSEQSIPALVAIAQDETMINSGDDMDLFFAAVQALAKISPDEANRAIPLLLDHFYSSGWYSRWAVGTLAHIKSSVAFEAMVNALRPLYEGTASFHTEFGPEVGSGISFQARILVHLGYDDPETLAAVLKEISVDAVIPVLASALTVGISYNPSFVNGTIADELRIAAANTLSALGTDTIPELLLILSPAQAQASFLEVLDNSELKIGLQHQDRLNRYAQEVLRRSLATEEGGSITASLIQSAQDSLLPIHQRQLAILTLRSLAVESALPTLEDKLVPALEAMLQDPAVRCDVALTLSYLGGMAAIPLLQKSFQNPELCPDIDFFIPLALGRLGSSVAQESLIELLLDLSHETITREEAATLLGQLKEPTVVPALTQALLYDSQFDSWGRFWGRNDIAADALASIGSDSARASLLRGLDHPDWFIRRRTATALAQLGSEAINELVERLADANRDHQRSAAYALGRLGPVAQDAIQPLTQVMNDVTTDLEVRRMAAVSLERIAQSSAGDFFAANGMVNPLTDYTCPTEQEIVIYAGRCVYPDLPVAKVGCCGSWSGLYDTVKNLLERAF